MLGICKKRNRDGSGNVLDPNQPLLKGQSAEIFVEDQPIVASRQRSALRHKDSINTRIQLRKFNDRRLRCLWRPFRARATLESYAELTLTVKIDPERIYDKHKSWKDVVRHSSMELEVHVNDTFFRRDLVEERAREYAIPIHEPHSIIRVVLRPRGTEGYWDILGFVEFGVWDLTPECERGKHPGKGFDGTFELRKFKQLIGTSRSRFESHALHSDKSSDNAIAGYIDMKGRVKIRSGDEVDEWYAYCLPEPVFINFEVGVNGQLDLERFYNHIMQIVHLGWEQGFRKLMGLFSVILLWRSWTLSTGIVLWFVLTHIYTWTYYPLMPFAWACAVYLLNNEHWSKRILAHEATATFDDEGFKQVADFNDSVRMATYVERVLMETKLNGQVSNYQGLTDFAGRLQKNDGRLRIDYDELYEKLATMKREGTASWITWSKQEVEENAEETPFVVRRVPPWLIPQGVKNQIMGWSDKAATIVEILEGMHKFKEQVFVKPAESGLFYVAMLGLTAALFVAFYISSRNGIGEGRDATFSKKNDTWICKRPPAWAASVTDIQSGQILIFLVVIFSMTPPLRFIRTFFRVRRSHHSTKIRRREGGCDRWDFYRGSAPKPSPDPVLARWHAILDA